MVRKISDPRTPTELQRLIAAAFDSQGWEYDLAVASRLIDALRAESTVEGERLAKALPGAFFQRNRVSKDLVAAAIDRAIGGRRLVEEERVPTTVVIGGNNYQMNVGPGASIVNANLNLGEGIQIVASTEADRQDVLLAVETIIRAGLAGHWNEDAAKELAAIVSDRSDLDYEEIQNVASEVVKAERPSQQRVKEFLGRIAASGLGGALATGITVGVGEAIAHLPL